MWRWAGATPTERRVRLAGSGGAVRVQEVGAGPPVVFIHGASNSGTSWATLAARLPDFRCILLDRPGCGLSDPAPVADAVGLAAFADTMAIDVLDALELDTASIVSTSYGGYFAFRAAAARPDRVTRIFEFGWMVGAPAPRLPLIMRFGNIPALGGLAGAVRPSPRMVRSMLRRVGLRDAIDAGKVPPEFIAAYTSLIRDTDTMRNEMALGRRLITGKTLDPRIALSDGLLASMSLPIAFLWGANEPFGDADVARAFAAKLPNAELEFTPGGHAVWVDDPDHAADRVRRFLAA
jgi:pimeloyl-ACP methyl ester carboxylesterase